MIKTIAIRNPFVIKLVSEELRDHGAGRDMVETAESMIAEAKSARDAKRASAPVGEQSAERCQQASSA